jgi:hypothetical protein
VPAGALMRIVSQAPLPAADRSAASGAAAGSRRRLAPTPVAQVTRDQNFAAQQQASAQSKKAPRRKLAPMPMTTPLPTKSFSSTVSFASAASQAQQGTIVETGPPAASAAESGSLQTPAKASYASAMSSQTTPAALTGQAGSQTTQRHGVPTLGSSMQPSTGGQARKHLANGEGQSAWSTPPDGRRNAANSGTKEDALSRRMAGLGLSSPGASKSPSALQQRSPWGEQSSFVSYSEGFSEQATHGSVNSLTPAASDSCADSALLSHKQQLGTPVSAQSCVGSNELPLSHSRRAPVTPGSAASVTSRLAKTDGAAIIPHDHLDSPAAQRSGSSLTFAGTPQEPGLPAPTQQPAAQRLQIGDVSEICAEGADRDADRDGDVSESPAVLAPHAKRAAAIHALLLSSTATCSLCAELEVLLHLLAVPESVSLPAGPDKPQPLLSSGGEAASYACAVLQDAGAPPFAGSRQQMSHIGLPLVRSGRGKREQDASIRSSAR